MGWAAFAEGEMATRCTAWARRWQRGGMRTEPVWHAAATSANQRKSVFILQRHCKARHAVPSETRFFVEGALNALTFGVLSWAAFAVVAGAVLG